MSSPFADRPLVLAPGLEGTGSLFAPLLDALQGDFRPQVVHYGERTKPFSAHVEDVAAAIRTAPGPALVVGESFGAIYVRNAINSGMPILTVAGIMDSGLRDGDVIRIDLEKSTLTAQREGLKLPAPKPFSTVQLDIYHAGSLFKVK